MKIMPLSQLVISLVLSLVATSPSLRGQNVFIITPEPGNLDGNNFLTPFNTSQSGRFQQVYDAALFSSLPAGGGSIFALNFRVDPLQGQSFSAVISNLQINLSTVTLRPDGLSPIFGDNIGANNTTVLGPVTAGIAGAGGGGFSVYLSLATPFYYDPAAGNLLVDFQIFTGAGTSPGRIGILDAFEVTGDGVSSVSAYGSSLPSIGVTSSLGLATAFSITPVPEPSAYALLAIGLGFLLFKVHRLKKRKEARHVAR